MNNKLAIITVAVTFFCSSCTKIFMSAYGIKEPRYLSKENISSISKGLDIPQEQSFLLKPDYFKALGKKDTLSFAANSKIKCSEMISKYKQPLQLMYFNTEGQLISFHNNCYAGGFPNLKWNHDGQFNQFIPITTVPLTDSVVNFTFLSEYLEPLSDNLTPHNSSIIIVLCWSDFMLRQSKRLIKVAKKNLELAKVHGIYIIYVNTDNCFLEEKELVNTIIK